MALHDSASTDLDLPEEEGLVRPESELDVAVLEGALLEALDPVASSWFEEGRAVLQHEPERIVALVARARRACGGGPLRTPGWTADEAARVLLLTALPGDGASLVERMQAVHARGTGRERAAVLRALDLLEPRVGRAALPLVQEALRTNDTTLVRFAVGSYAGTWLDDAAWRQAVLKCVFTGVPLEAVSGLERRADDELAQMLGAFADERLAAGRTVPADVERLLGSLRQGRPGDEAGHHEPLHDKTLRGVPSTPPRGQEG